MRALRYAIYGYLFSAIVLSAAMQNQTLSSLLCLLVMLPAMVHTAMQGSLTWARFAHVLEALSLPALLYSLRCSQELLYLASISLVVCNGLLWGARSLPSAVSVLALVLALFQPATNSWSESVTYVVAIILVVWVVNAAHRRTQHVSRGEHKMIQQNQWLRRCFPEGFLVRVEDNSVRVWMTVTFIDLCGFTSAVERLPHEDTQLVLNDFFSKLHAPIKASGGVVYKFLGDGILCGYRALEVETRTNCARACLGGVGAVRLELKNLNRSWHQRGLPSDFEISIGIASGYCTLGDWGSPARMDYTVIGSAVNLASRLQELAPPGFVYIDESTAAFLGNNACDDAGSFEIKGLGTRRVYAALPHRARVC